MKMPPVHGLLCTWKNSVYQRHGYGQRMSAQVKDLGVVGQAHSLTSTHL